MQVERGATAHRPDALDGDRGRLRRPTPRSNGTEAGLSDAVSADNVAENEPIFSFCLQSRLNTFMRALRAFRALDRGVERLPQTEIGEHLIQRLLGNTHIFSRDPVLLEPRTHVGIETLEDFVRTRILRIEVDTGLCAPHWKVEGCGLQSHRAR